MTTAYSPYIMTADSVLIDFSEALIHLKQGKRVARAGWNGKGMWIALQAPTLTSRMTLPYIYMYTASGDFVPWLASQTDLLASDWVVVEDEA